MVELKQRRCVRPVVPAVLLFGVGLIAGLPSLRGGFLSGDDYHLVLNHVLVNHPSFRHALELFTIVHRDLYQPIPMLSFSIDFALAHAFGLDPTDSGPRAGAWLFHLTNVLIHALNVVLVFHVVRRLATAPPGLGERSTFEATIDGRAGTSDRSDALFLPAAAAVVFAVHPLSAEPIAWLNGRMMLLSACFTLAGLLAFERWYERPSGLRAAGVILLALLAHGSKVSAAAPVLIAILAIQRGRRPLRRWWLMWGAITVLTAAFAGFAIVSSQGMIDDARAEMPASPALYCVLALGQYIRQFLLPIGLSPWYPPPQQIGWTDPRVLTAVAVIAVVAIAVVVSLRHTRVGILGLSWFLFAVAPTLPFVPARRSIGADRYVYLPNVGLVWIAATVVVALFAFLDGRARGVPGVAPGAIASRTFGMGNRRRALTIAVPGGAIVVMALLLTNWSAQSPFASNIAQAHRIIELNPDHPGVYESAAWAYYREGRFEEAIDIAGEDLSRHPDTMACEVYQVMGMSQLRLNRPDEAVETLKRAVASDPKYGKAYSRLAKAQEETGQIDEAIVLYERAAELMPQYNPGLLELAGAYRTVGRVEDAVRLYERVLDINAFDVTAQLALAEIEIEKQQFAAAAARLATLLDWMPENTVARTNLGVAYEGLNRPDAAAEAYRDALERNEYAATALVNLGNLYSRHGRTELARQLYFRFVPANPIDGQVLAAFHDFALRTNDPASAAALLRKLSSLYGNYDLPRHYAAYASVQAGEFELADELMSYYRGPLFFPDFAARNVEPCRFGGCALSVLIDTLISLHRGHTDEAINDARSILMTKNPFPPDARDRLIADMQRFAETHPSDPWPYYITAMVLIAQDRHDFAGLAVDEFLARCPDDACRARADGLRTRIDAGLAEAAGTE